jgi:hypothetical protein
LLSTLPFSRAFSGGSLPMRDGEQGMNERAKILTVTVLLMSACGYGVWKYRSLQPSPAINNGVTSEFGGPRSESERKNFQEQAAAYADITPDQMKKLEEMRKQFQEGRARGGPREGLTSMAQVLTPDQRVKMFEFFRSQRDASAKKAMSPQQYDAYKAKREQMRDRWRNFGGGGNRGGPGGQGSQPAGPRA